MASIFSRFFGRTVSEAAGVAAGIAVASPLRPVVQLVENETWALHPDKPVPAPLAAAIVAENVEAQGWGEEQASWTGFSKASFDAMLGEALKAPGIGELFEAWRRNLIDDAAFTHGLRKAKLEPRWDTPLMALKERLLSSEELANAQQQEFIDETRANEEAALQGVTAERQQIRFKLAGLPPGVETGLQMLRRGIITEAEFAEIVATGHTKTKWTPQLEALRNVVLNAATYAGLHLRGWISEPEMVAGGALTGYTQEQMDLLFKEHGRPATGHQVLVGLRRGGTYNGPLTGIPQPFIDAIRQSNIRPEWTNILWHAVVNYPPLFQLTRLVQANVINATTGADWAYKQGSPDEVVAALRTYWSQGVTATGKEQTKAELLTEYEGGFITESELRDHLTALGYSGPALDLEVHLGDARRIRGWRDKAITALGKRYVASTMDATAADGYLVEIGVPDPGTRASIIRIWDIEREFK